MVALSVDKVDALLIAVTLPSPTRLSPPLKNRPLSSRTLNGHSRPLNCRQDPPSPCVGGFRVMAPSWPGFRVATPSLSRCLLHRSLPGTMCTQAIPVRTPGFRLSSCSTIPDWLSCRLHPSKRVKLFPLLLPKQTNKPIKFQIWRLFSLILFYSIFLFLARFN